MVLILILSLVTLYNEILSFKYILDKSALLTAAKVYIFGKLTFRAVLACLGLKTSRGLFGDFESVLQEVILKLDPHLRL